jgi:hypothetical protein
MIRHENNDFIPRPPPPDFREPFGSGNRSAAHYLPTASDKLDLRGRQHSVRDVSDPGHHRRELQFSADYKLHATVGRAVHSLHDDGELYGD